MRVVRREYVSPAGAILTIINFIFGIILLVIGLRILFLLLGANPNSGFVDFIYSISGAFISPFAGIFPDRVIDNNFYLDAAAIIAFLVYLLLMWLINYVFDRFATNTEVERRD